MNKIEIHYDFSIGHEISFFEGLRRSGSFTTHALDFFSHDYISPDRDVVIVRSDGAYISTQEIYQGTHLYSDKEIRPAHNIRKLFLSGHFDWRHPDVLWNQEGYCSHTSMVITDLDAKYHDNLLYNIPMKTVNLIEHIITKTVWGYNSIGTTIPPHIRSSVVDNVKDVLHHYKVKIEDEGLLLNRNILLAPYIGKLPQGRTGTTLTISTDTHQPATWRFPLHESQTAIILRYNYDLYLLTEEQLHDTSIPPVLQRMRDDGLSYQLLIEPNKGTRLTVSLDNLTLFTTWIK